MIAFIFLLDCWRRIRRDGWDVRVFGRFGIIVGWRDRK